MIASLTEDLAPVRSFSPRHGALLVTAAVAVSIAAVVFFEGFWHGPLAGEAAPFFWIATGLLLVLGLSAASAVIMMASPRVGNRHDAPKWASAMFAVLPVAAVISVLPHEHGAQAITSDMYGMHCFLASLASSLSVGAAMILWLRQGAPVSLNTTGWFTGIAAGSLGTLAYGLSCSIDTVTHLGIWHVLPVAVSALVGRIVVPPLVRW